MDWARGKDTNQGTAASPWKTITHALAQVTGPGCTIEVVGGAGRVHDTTFETFPLTIVHDDTTIRGDDQFTSPEINLIGADVDDLGTLVNTPQHAAFYLDGVGGCVIQNLRIDGSSYPKETHYMAGDADSGVAGISIFNWKEGTSLGIIGCVVDDTSNGIIFHDDMTWVPGDRRVVTINNTDVYRCGPWQNPTVEGDVGHAGVRLIEAESEHIDLHVSNCEFHDNHDALEPEAARLMLKSTLFMGNENGLEYADTPGGMVYVLGCTFEHNETFDPNDGGVAGPTGAIVCRYTSPGYDLTVRDTDFIDNQLGISLKAAPGMTGEVDLGDGIGGLEDHVFTPPVLIRPAGNNTFDTDTTCPWPAVDSYRVSYCGLFSKLSITVQAVGNTWTYHDTSNPGPAECQGVSDECPGTPGDCNQGVDSSGQVSQPDSVFGPDSNYSSSIDFPFHRALDSYGAQLQVHTPWNFATGPEFLITGLPAIRLTLP